MSTPHGAHDASASSPVSDRGPIDTIKTVIRIFMLVGAAAIGYSVWSGVQAEKKVEQEKAKVALSLPPIGRVVVPGTNREVIHRGDTFLAGITSEKEDALHFVLEDGEVQKVELSSCDYDFNESQMRGHFSFSFDGEKWYDHPAGGGPVAPMSARAVWIREDLKTPKGREFYVWCKPR